MKQVPLNPEGYKLLHDGAITLARVSNNGIRVDVPYYKTALLQVSKRIRHLEKEMHATDVWEEWRKAFGASSKLTSRQQLATVLFDKMGFNAPGLGDSGNYKCDSDVLDTIDHPFIDHYMQAEKLRKLSGTYLQGTLDEVSPDGYLRCFYNLHLARTYRSSASNPNIQNQPVRDPLQGRIIRRGFIPRDGHRICEIDYSSIEVRVAACYHKDPAMMRYLTDPTTDMHRDMAAQIFMLEPGDVSKAARHIGKNSFVFPSFYGDYYVSIARGIWTQMLKSKITTGSGVPILEHLRSKGITQRGACDGETRAQPHTFEHHIQAVETDFWKRRFQVYVKWKTDFYDAYIRKGYFTSLSGMTFSGVMRKNVVINAPVQSAAFHCLLWSLTEIQKELDNRRMRSVIIGQIHDSCIADVHEDEMDEYLQIASNVMTVKLKERFPWIGSVPIDVEAEACDVGGTWYDKKVIQIPGVSDV